MFKSIKNGLRIVVFGALFVALALGAWLVSEKKVTADSPSPPPPPSDGGGDGGDGGGGGDGDS
ncbi:MAG: hypothetical protein A2665_02755 [Candidatus Zambryskibacteria bacterium RIFCSPHIGHO2_01_FULL_46_30]|uniref:Uncharacterized protein n=1 Tax=Candidatus Zambryskibacteria bacterium RIFCSPHIGHO2_01_FULL_46_30 TaxID=1802739 RepID=A0A1G2T060_9BACT|nr:MAG: hypothetical protein A2665_02755 [Candidatus Zambryskibacteria bacterium RIFCSPHIGHO2_01_FULL_46_30]OHB05154.1 MAG: hypothetical protein A3B22_02585 [Candidatus Zambryskibacteria bacterium RIFCSPLOWO2_01_FULL_47_33]